jgi:hypothetical protein
LRLTVSLVEKERTKYDELHQSIVACDNVLKSVEVSLAGFQKDLGLVSAEIETLQNRSVEMNTRLENRRVVEKLLGPAVEEISISPMIIRTISEGTINEDWVAALSELEKKIKAIESKSGEAENIKAIEDVKPLLENLKKKAVQRIRDYLVSQIKGLRSPNINAQIIQQQNLLKYRSLFSFLHRQHGSLSNEIAQAYVNTMRWYYSNNFSRYRSALDKLALITIDKADALGSDPAAPRAKTSGSTVMKDPFSIGRRNDILTTTNHTAISSYLAEETKTPHHIELPFRNFNLALVDNLCSEFAFVAEFFSPEPFHALLRRCTEIFEPTFSLGQQLTRDLVDTSFDCLGILVCVRLNQHNAFELQRRKVPVGDGYINATTMLLWPRFQVAMDAHCESIKTLAASTSGRSAASKLTSSAHNSSASSTAPHYLTQRFGQFLASVLTLSSSVSSSSSSSATTTYTTAAAAAAADTGAADDEPLSSSLTRVRTEYENFLAKAARGVGADPKKRARFLGSNYALVLTIIGDVGGKVAGEQRTYFELLQNKVEAESRPV